MTLSTLFSCLTLSDHSRYITANHLEELNYDRHELEKYANFINKRVAQCHRTGRDMRIRKRYDSKLPFTFRIDCQTATTMKVVIIFPKTIKDAELYSNRVMRIKKSISIQINFSLKRPIVTVSRKEIWRYSRNFTNTDDILPQLARNIQTPQVLLYTCKNDKRRAEIEFDPEADSMLSAINDKKLCLSQAMSIVSAGGKSLQILHDTFGRGNTDVYRLAISAFTALIPNFDYHGIPGPKQWLSSEEDRAKLLCHALLDSFTEIADFLQSTPKTIPGVLNCIDTVIARKIARGESVEQLQLLLAKTKAQAAIIYIMAREEENCSRVREYYITKKEIPTLSTAESLANELHTIHLGLTPNKHFFTSPILCELLDAHLKQAGWSANTMRVVNVLKKQLLDRSSEMRESKKMRHVACTFATRNLDANTVLLHIIQPKTIHGALLGSGSFKKTKTATTISLTFSPSKNVEIRAETTATQRFKKCSALDGAERALRMHQELVSKVPPGTNIAAVPHIRRYTNYMGVARIELDTVKYHSSLGQAAKETTTLTKSDSIRLLADIGDVLQATHDAGIVHKDVTLRNMLLLKTGLAGPYTSYLNDFDLTDYIGSTAKGAQYAYWDKCAREGITLPNADVFGLTACAVEILVRPFCIAEILTMLQTEGSPGALFRKILLRYSGVLSPDEPANTIAELVQSVERCHTNAYVIARTRAQAKIIEILVREIASSQKLFEYYSENATQFKEDIRAFLEGAKAKIPTLSTARSLANELRDIQVNILDIAVQPSVTRCSSE